MEDRIIYWLWLKLMWPLYDRKALRLISEFGSAEAVFAADEKRIRALSFLTADEQSTILQKDLSAARSEAKMCESLGIRILTLRDERYPGELLPLPDPPVLFYAKGDLGLLADHPKLTVVGSRKATPQGVSITMELAKSLAANGVLIVSGMAEGIDGAAHVGALRVRGKTIAVLGCGMDVPYPARNLELKEEIGEKGLLLSEFPLGTAALRTNFPYRNRVLSALSDGTLVTEAGQGSGALITARGAIELGKNVYALPWSVDHFGGLGGNRLLRDGGAQMVFSGEEIMEDLSALPQMKDTVRPEKMLIAGEPDFVPPKPQTARSEKPKKASAPKVELTPEEAAVWAALQEKHSFDDLIGATRISAGELTGILVMMEVKGLIRKESGNRYYIK